MDGVDQAQAQSKVPSLNHLHSQYFGKNHQIDFWTNPGRGPEFERKHHKKTLIIDVTGTSRHKIH